jgi:acetyltransferase-like isoleucine patch superfamily enzyme
MEKIIHTIKSNPRLKSLVLFLLMPSNQARPRKWVQLFVNPLKHKKAKGVLIRKRTRIDVLPFNRFEIGENSTIEDFATINNGLGDVIIGERTRIGISNVLIGPVKIGNDVILAQNIVISGLNHSYDDIKRPIKDQECTKGEIVIEDDAWIGANAVITAGVRIGKHSVVAAGSVVTKDVPPYSIAVGNPARVVKQYDFATGKWEKVKSNSSENGS